MKTKLTHLLNIKITGVLIFAVLIIIEAYAFVAFSQLALTVAQIMIMGTASGASNFVFGYFVFIVFELVVFIWSIWRFIQYLRM
jgi:flagellar biosynthesis protein FlhB